MKIRERLQLYPLSRIAVFLAAGIVAGKAAFPSATYTPWYAALAFSLLAAFALRGRSVAQSMMIHLAVLFLGGGLAAGRLEMTDAWRPEGYFTYRAVVAGEPVVRAKTVSCDLIVADARKPFKIRAAFMKDGRAMRLCVGEGIKAVSILKAPRGNRSSGFDYAEYLRYRGVAAVTFIYTDCWHRTSVDITGLPLTERARLAALRLRHSLSGQYAEAGLRGQELAVVSAMTLGDKSLLSKKTKDAYSISGASHILALSGMHLGIIYCFLYILLLRRGRHFPACLILTASIWGYVFIVGMPTSAVRAAVMLTAYTLSDMMGRERLSLNALSFAAAVMLTANPLCLYEVSFQLSLMAMLSIILFFNPLYGMFPGKLRSFCLTDKLIKCIAISLSAQLGVAPLIVYYFGSFPCYFFLTNIIVSLAALVILNVSAVLFMTAFAPCIQSIVSVILSSVVSCQNHSVSFIASLPGAGIAGLHISALQVLMIYVIIFSCHLFACYILRTGKYRHVTGSNGTE